MQTGLLDAATYRNLRTLAHRIHAERSPEDSLDPVGLLHEAWIKLERSQAARFRDRRHFFAVCARAMRQVLMEDSRHQAARGDER